MTTATATKRSVVKNGVLEGPVPEMPAVIRDAQPTFYAVYSDKVKGTVWIRPCPKCNATGSIRQTFRKTNETRLVKCFACAAPGHPEMNAGKGYQTVADYERNTRYRAHREEQQQHFSTNVKASLLKIGIPETAFGQVAARSDDDSTWSADDYVPF